MFSRRLLRDISKVIIRRGVKAPKMPLYTQFSAAAAHVTHRRFGQVEVFGPFDPPKQLTFSQVEERVLKAVRSWDRFPADKESQLKLDAEFAKDLGFDSLDHVEIMMAVEDEFGFEIPLQDSEKLKTPRDVFKYICEREDVFE